MAALAGERQAEKPPVSDAPQIGPAQAPPPPAAFAQELSQHGRGRRSKSPLQIPWKGWKDILWRTYERTGEDRLLAIAAGVVFFALLAVFPAITALVSCYGLFANPSTIGDNLQTLALMLPEGSFRSCRTRSRACWPRATPRSALPSCSASRWRCGAPMPGSRR